MALSTGSKTTVGFPPVLTGGSPVAANALTGTGARIGRFGIAADLATKGLALSGSGNLPLGAAGRVVPVALVGKVSNKALGLALGRFVGAAGGPMGFAVITAGTIAIPAVMDWLESADLETGGPSGFQKRRLGDVCVSGCLEWSPYDTAGGWYKGSAAAAQAVADWAAPRMCPSNASNCSSRVDRIDFEAYPIKVWVHETFDLNTGGVGSSDNAYSIVSRPTPGYDLSSVEPVELPDVLAALEAVQPSPEVLQELFTIDQTGRYSDQLLKDLAVQNVVASGPSTVIGPVETKTEPATSTTPEKTTTTKTDYNCVYVMADVTCTDKKTETATTTKINPATGLPETETTTTTTEKEPETKQEDPCNEHPNRNGCREDEFDIPDGEIPKIDKTITFQAEDLGFGGGSCPANKTMMVGGQSITVVDWAENCSYITTYAKPMILAMAFFSAMMIIFVGGKIE